IVLLNDACACAMPSATFLRTFLRTRCAALLAGDLAMLYSLLLQGLRGATRTLAGTGVRAGALATHRQATTMTEAAVAADVHQTLDVHRRFATQVAFDRELGDLVADLFQIGVRQVLDLLRVVDASGFADLASARAADAEDRRQA